MFLSEIEFSRLKQQDPEVFEKLYNEYKVEIYNFLIYQTRGNQEIAKELFSETVCSAFVSVTKLKNKHNLKGWLLLVAKRRFMDYLRKSYREKKYLESVYYIYNKNEILSEEFLKMERIILMKTALENIREDYRKVLTLKFIDNKSIKEIAIIINKTESAITNILHRAKKMVRTEMNRLEGTCFKV